MSIKPTTYHQPPTTRSRGGFTPSLESVTVQSDLSMGGKSAPDSPSLDLLKISSKHKRAVTLFSAGFTLIELMVSVAVIALVTAVIVYNQGDFSDKISLVNTASDIELQIREAQVYGVSVREFQPSSNEFNFAYGVSINLNAFAGTLGPTSYVSFIDRVTKDARYATPAQWETWTVGGASEC